jgi:hypothetical protein
LANGRRSSKAALALSGGWGTPPGPFLGRLKNDSGAREGAPRPDWAQTTNKLLAGLERHHILAIGVVNEEKLEDDGAAPVELLRRWLDAGMDLGNQT